MILTAHQPTYLSWIGLLAKIAQADTFCSFDVVQMEDSGFENRNRIKTSSGPQWLTVPVRRSRDIIIRDLEICTEQPWQRKHWRSIEMSYSKARFWDRYEPVLKAMYLEKTWTKLTEVNAAFLAFFMREFGLLQPVTVASDYGPEGTKSALVLDLCRKIGATEYIFGSQGRAYADVPAFEAAGVRVGFQEFAHPEYPQQHGEFVPNLSALDLLLNVGPDSGAMIRSGLCDRCNRPRHGGMCEATWIK